MKRGVLQRLHNKELKEGLESYSRDGYHCVLTNYVSAKEVYVTFDDGVIVRTRFDRFKKEDFCKYRLNSSDSWDDYRMNGVKRVPTELLVKDFFENLGFKHQGTLDTRPYISRLIYQKTPNVYLYDFINYDLGIIIEIDGRSHNKISAQKVDRNKEMLSYLYGYRLFRFKNEYVKDYTEDFKEEIMSILKGVVL